MTPRPHGNTDRPAPRHPEPGPCPSQPCPYRPDARTPPASAAERLLPRVPLPTLEDSCARFLDWCDPLLTDAERAETEAGVRELLARDSPAHRLQAALAAHDTDTRSHSWLDDFWQHRYLGRRDRIALNANYSLLLHGARQDQAERAAALIAAFVRHKTRADAGTLPPATLRGEALSTRQTRSLYSTTRIPGTPRDTVRGPGGPGSPPARHVVVLHQGSFFRLAVAHPAGPYTTGQLAAGLRAILAAGPLGGRPEHSPGQFTTLDRATWARIRQDLLDCHPANAAALDTVETALFCVCLEDTTPDDTRHACEQLLHGDSRNRWYDKSLSLIVFRDGTAGLNVEHCDLDGTTLTDALAAALDNPPADPRTDLRTPAPAPHTLVGFTLDAGLRARAEAAGRAFTAYAAECGLLPVRFEAFGTSAIKQLGISPDAFVHLAFQLARWRLHGATGTTYESISTRRFRHGRTEAMRVVTRESARFTALMDDPAADPAARAAAARAAAARHVDRAADCRSGRAPEQHLWQIHLLQQHHGGHLGAPEPFALFDTPGWRILRDDRLSTSSVASPHVAFFGFGPTGDQCLGIAYAMLPDTLNFHLSARGSAREEPARFAARLREALTDLRDLLSGAPGEASAARG